MSAMTAADKVGSRSPRGNINRNKNAPPIMERGGRFIPFAGTQMEIIIPLKYQIGIPMIPLTES